MALVATMPERPEGLSLVFQGAGQRISVVQQAAALESKEQ